MLLIFCRALSSIASIFHSSLPTWAFQPDSGKPFEMTLRHLGGACTPRSNSYGLFIYLYKHLHRHRAGQAKAGEMGIKFWALMSQINNMFKLSKVICLLVILSSMIETGIDTFTGSNKQKATTIFLSAKKFRLCNCSPTFYLSFFFSFEEVWLIFWMQIILG